MSVSFSSNDYVGEGFKPFFNGWANAQITDVSCDDNSSGTGKLLMLEFTLLEGQDKGRTVKQFYNYVHHKEEAERIAREHICEIARHIGVADIQLPEKAGAFMNGKIRVKVSQKPKDDYPSIKQYEKSPHDGFGDLEDSNDFALQGRTEPSPTRQRDPYAQR